MSSEPILKHAERLLEKNKALRGCYEALAALEPYLDRLVGHASTVAEYEPHRLVANARVALTRVRGEEDGDGGSLGCGVGITDVIENGDGGTACQRGNPGGCFRHLRPEPCSDCAQETEWAAERALAAISAKENRDA